MAQDNQLQDKEQAFLQLQKTIHDNIPPGFSAGELYKMPSWFISLEDYPAGYHCKKNEPLPFLSVALQKSHIAIYHMGMYAEPTLLNWFETEFQKRTGKKPDMGKSCIRFKKPGEIPFELLGELVSKMTPSDWIKLYEAAFRKGK